MMRWIEAHSPPVIALVMFGFCYALAAITFGAAAITSRRAKVIAKDLKAVSPATITPLAVILGLLFAFLAARVWSNLDRAREYVGQEASALREAVLLADTLPSDVRGGVRQAIKNHLRFIEVEDWPAMAKAQASMQQMPVGLIEAMAVLLSFAPEQPNQQLAQQRALVAIERALEIRRSRIQLSRTEIAPIQWTVIVVLVALLLVTIAVLHIDAHLAQAATMLIFATAVAICLTLLMIYDRPFAAGGFTMTPAVLREVVPD
jgi:DNA-binding transcriptional regulator YdaS (Cro superfamily)